MNGGNGYGQGQLGQLQAAQMGWVPPAPPVDASALTIQLGLRRDAINRILAGVPELQKELAQIEAMLSAAGQEVKP